MCPPYELLFHYKAVYGRIWWDRVYVPRNSVRQNHYRLHQRQDGAIGNIHLTTFFFSILSKDPFWTHLTLSILLHSTSSILLSRVERFFPTGKLCVVKILFWECNTVDHTQSTFQQSMFFGTTSLTQSYLSSWSCLCSCLSTCFSCIGLQMMEMVYSAEHWTSVCLAKN